MFIPIDDAQIFTTAFGPRGDIPILALSGWIGSWEDWIDTLGPLSDHHRVISYDHRGSGSTLAPVESITYARLVDDVFAVLDAHGIERCVLAAMSMGAAVALGAALKQPERIAGLVLVNGAYVWQSQGDADPFLAGLRHHYAQTVAGFVELCVPEPDSAAIKHWGRQILGRATQEAAIALYRITAQIDLRPEVGRIQQPTLIIHGDADRLIPLAAAEWLAKALPNARLTVLPGAGHVPIMTRPREVAAAIEAFLVENIHT